jgi:hypothetical protein
LYEHLSGLALLDSPGESQAYKIELFNVSLDVLEKYRDVRLQQLESGILQIIKSEYENLKLVPNVLSVIRKAFEAGSCEDAEKILDELQSIRELASQQDGIVSPVLARLGRKSAGSQLARLLRSAVVVLEGVFEKVRDSIRQTIEESTDTMARGRERSVSEVVTLLSVGRRKSTGDLSDSTLLPLGASFFSDSSKSGSATHSSGGDLSPKELCHSPDNSHSEDEAHVLLGGRDSLRPVGTPAVSAIIR